MVKRALVIWVLMLALASVNGAVRELLLIPMIGDVAGRAVSSLTLSGLVLLLAYLTIPWIHPRSGRETWVVGGLWVALTLAFEFLAGHFLFGNAWSQLLEDYNVLRGRIWILVLITTALAPFACARIRGLLPRPGRGF
jgi:hypothetical protein